jgi:KDO2-lipid IV(A) lauroyltransferase
MLAHIPNRARNTTRRNLETCFPNQDKTEILALTRESLIHTACTALEMGIAWIAPIEKTLGLIISNEGYDKYRADVDGDRGVILLAPHLSNWEVFGFFASEGVAANFMYQPPRSHGLDRLLRQARSRNGVKMAPTNKRGVAQLLAALKNGEMVGILPDQVPADESGVFANFFEEPALTMTLVSKLVQRTGAKVYCGYARRLRRGEGFCAVFREADPAIYSSNLEESVQGLNNSVENAVLEAVSQYQWEYKRFRRRPDNSEFYS